MAFNKPASQWLKNSWRPLMALMYMVVCFADFVLFPLLWSIMQVYASGTVTLQWQPITLQGAGLFHMAMGAVIGVTAYGRTQEKITGTHSETVTVLAPSSNAPITVSSQGKPGPTIIEDPV
jgi:hypothetical protein